jgi:site-specific DNA-adenine methylase
MGIFIHMKLEVAEYIELKDGGAVVIFEMDEETRTGLISEAIQRRIMEGLEKIKNDPNQIDLEEYLKGMEEG